MLLVVLLALLVLAVYGSVALSQFLWILVVVALVMMIYDRSGRFR